MDDTFKMGRSWGAHGTELPTRALVSSLFLTFRAQTGIKYLTISIVSLSICHEVMELDAMIFVF